MVPEKPGVEGYVFPGCRLRGILKPEILKA